MSKEKLNDLVNTEVYKLIDEATAHYIRAEKVNNELSTIKEAGERLKKTNHWRIYLSEKGITMVDLNSETVMAKEVKEALLQFLSLLEAIHYSERKDLIQKFNNILKNGSNTEK